MGRFAGKIAVVTGGSRGIGLAVVVGLLAEGASILFTGMSVASVAAAEAKLPRDRCHGLRVDLADPAAADAVIAAAHERFGAIDLLVNNAGATGPVDPWTVDRAAWDRVIAVNLDAVFFLARAAAEAMRGRGGSIVNLSSAAAQIGGAATGPAYVAAKAGVIGLTRSLARHFAPLKVRVNCVAPADIETDMTASWPAELRQRLTAMTPLGRFGRPDEVVGAVLYLAGDEASFVTGQTINVNGGLYMG
jgi:3-oxoacyl-[acyl-carrier protein] reductase